MNGRHPGGIYIKGMEMPKNCCICPFSSHDMCLLCKRDAEDWFENRPEYCPLVEVPDHGDLIDRDDLIERIDLFIDDYAGVANMGVWAKDVVDAPAIIPAERREE
jgi:hypothetical protein